MTKALKFWYWSWRMSRAGTRAERLYWGLKMREDTRD